MAKKRTKKLDLVLAELAKLRSEVQALGKELGAGRAKKKPAARKARPAAAKRKSATSRGKASGAGTPARKAASPPKRPVLVGGSDAAQNARESSQG